MLVFLQIQHTLCIHCALTHYLPCSIPGTLPVYVNLDPTSFEPGLHTITIVANSTVGQVATFSYNFTVPDIISKLNNILDNNNYAHGIFKFTLHVFHVQ